MGADFEEVNLFKYVTLVKSGVTDFIEEKKYIATGSLINEKIVDYELITYDSRPSRANMEFKKDDVIFAKMQDTVKVFLIDDDASQNIYSTGFAGLRIKDKTKILPEYLFYYILSDVFQNEKNKNCSGATQKAINNSNLKKFNILIPSIEIQKEIVNQLNKIYNLKLLRHKSLELSDLYLKSVFMELFGDPINNTKNWDIVCLKEFGEIKTGNTPPRKNPENYGEYMEWIKSDNINTSNIYLTKSNEMLSEEGVKRGRVVPKGSVLVTCIAGSIDCLGNVAVANRVVSFNQQINAIIPNKKVNELFLYHLILYTKNYLQTFSTSVLKGMINKKTFSEIPMILPPIELQNQFAEIVQQVEIIKKYQNQSKEELDNLFNNLMQKAFKGELIC